MRGMRFFSVISVILGDLPRRAKAQMSIVPLR